jgi:hypothetical protein
VNPYRYLITSQSGKEQREAALRKIVNAIHNVEHINPRRVHTGSRRRRGSRTLWVVKHEAGGGLGRHSGLRAFEGDGVVPAVIEILIIMGFRD